MDVSLSPEMEQFVREQVDAGNFSTEEEVVGEALRLLRENEEVDRRKRAERGEGRRRARFTEMIAEAEAIAKFETGIDDGDPSPGTNHDAILYGRSVGEGREPS